MKVQDINRSTPEGRLLFAALAILTTTDELVIGGQYLQGTMRTPDEMLEILETSADTFMDKYGEGLPAEVYKERAFVLPQTMR